MLHGSVLGPHLFKLYCLGDLCWPQNFKAHLYGHFPQSMPLALATGHPNGQHHLAAMGYIKSASQLLILDVTLDSHPLSTPYASPILTTLDNVSTSRQLHNEHRSPSSLTGTAEKVLRQISLFSFLPLISSVLHATVKGKILETNQIMAIRCSKFRKGTSLYSNENPNFLPRPMRSCVIWPVSISQSNLDMLCPEPIPCVLPIWISQHVHSAERD